MHLPVRLELRLERPTSGGGSAHQGTCRWLPLEQPHVLNSGFGARLARIEFVPTA